MSILKIAASQLGTKEISGNEDNPQIVKYSEETGITGINNDETPWCSTFINWCAEQAGLPMSGKANARSWIDVGTTVQDPEPGDIVVFWRESPDSWKGHVGFFLGFNKDATRVFCLGGNQGNAVSILDYDVEKVLAYRRLETKQELSIPKPILKKESRGLEVIKLQLVLNHLKYNCGDADGVFGVKTETALKLLQTKNHLTSDGIYGNESKNCVESLLQL
ncbi:MAG: TIGR02594 family protein [Bacteroidales bacterium]|nr:TIGR02594 family protein [Bacteroidales bacterium]